MGRGLIWGRLGLILLLNLIPVAGVLWLGWSAGQILILYWIENIIIGAASLVRILTARGVADPTRKTVAATASIGLGCFFTIHYGLFTLGHGVFTLILAANLMGGAGPLRDGVLFDTGFHWAVLAAAVLQVIILIREWWWSGLWRRSTPSVEMSRPYGRIIVLHVTVLAYAWWLGETAAPVSAVLILCVMKGVIELGLTALGSRRNENRAA